MATLVFFSGTMDCGKSTLALQIDHNHRARGRSGLIFTKLDRAGDSVLSSRLGLATDAVEVHDDLDFWDTVVGCLTAGARVDTPPTVYRELVLFGSADGWVYCVNQADGRLGTGVRPGRVGGRGRHSPGRGVPAE